MFSFISTFRATPYDYELALLSGVSLVTYFFQSRSQSAAHNFEYGSRTPAFSAQVDHGVAYFLPIRLEKYFARSRLAAG